MEIHIQLEQWDVSCVLDIPERNEYPMVLMIGEPYLFDCLKQISLLLKQAGYASLCFTFQEELLYHICDFKKILALIKQHIHFHKLYLLGYRQGGVVANMLASMFSDYIDGVILLAPVSMHESIDMSTFKKNVCIIQGKEAPEKDKAIALAYHQSFPSSILHLLDKETPYFNHDQNKLITFILNFLNICEYYA